MDGKVSGSVGSRSTFYFDLEDIDIIGSSIRNSGIGGRSNDFEEGSDAVSTVLLLEMWGSGAGIIGCARALFSSLPFPLRS